MFAFLDDAELALGSTSANVPTTAISPADDVKPEPTSSKKRAHKDTAPPTERPHKCPICSHAFARADAMARQEG
ncbi:hypothetical protein GGI16_004657, partial [Coemansia sp. S142-1]